MSLRQASALRGSARAPFAVRILHLPAVLLVVSVLASAPHGLASDVTVHAERCGPQFDAAVAAQDVAGPSGDARVATALMRVALEALEPSHPIVRAPGRFDDPNAAWLDARGVLPSDWNEASLEPSTWRSMLARLQRPYEVEPRPISGSVDRVTLRAEIEEALAAGAAAVRPLALVGVERGASGTEEVAFATVIWNWTPRPRLLAFALSGEAVPADGVEALLPRMGTCAWTPRSWARAPADVARDFYTGNVATEVRIIARPDRAIREEIAVARGDEEAAFRLEHPALRGAPYASLGFLGPGPSVATVLRLVVSIRTNLGLFDLGRYLSIP